MSWLYLILAIVFEVTGTTAMKLSDGFQHPLPSITVFVCYGCSIGLLTLAVRSIDISRLPYSRSKQTLIFIRPNDRL